MYKKKNAGLMVTVIPSNDIENGTLTSENLPFNNDLSSKLSQIDINDHLQKKIESEVHIKQNFGELSGEDINKITDIGFGNGGVVWSVRHKKSGKIMALKRIRLEVKQSVRNQIFRELQVLKDCHSPQIVGYYGNFYSDTTLNICMEYMDGGSLDLIMKKVGRIPEPIIGMISLSVLRGLNYLRENHKIIHRDVKPSNILVNTQGEIKLCDFGVSGELIDSLANTFVGTRSYMSPERLQGEQYSVQSDIWSMGLSLTEMAFGRFPIPIPTEEDIDNIFGNCTLRDHIEAAKNAKPFPRPKNFSSNSEDEFSISIFDLLEYIVNEPPPVIPERHFSPEFKNMVSITLKKQPKERSDLQKLMDDPFIKKTEHEYCKSINFAFWIQKMIDLETPSPFND